MHPGPIQITLLAICLGISVVLAVVMARKPALSYIRGTVVVGLCACLAQETIGLLFLSHPNGASWTGAYLASELGGSLVWLFFAKRYTRLSAETSASSPPWMLVVPLGALVGAMAALPGLFTHQADVQAPLYPLTVAGFSVRLATLAILIMALAALETTLANSVHGQRWRIKFTILGVIAILIAQLFTVSLGLLYRSLDLSLATTRQTGFVLGSSMILYSILFRGGESPVTISKKLAKSSVVLFGVGVYLLFLGVLSLVMRMTGHSGNMALLLALGLIGGMGVLVLLLSESLRRKCNRVLQNYFYKEKYDYRVQWLSFTKRLSRTNSRGDLYRAVLLGFSETFGMCSAVLYLKAQDGSHMLPVQTWEVDTPPPLEDWSLVTRAVSEGKVVVDLRGAQDGLDSASLAFFQDQQAAFAVPLRREDTLDGLILLSKPIDSTEDYNQEDFDLMEAQANQALSAILNHRLTDQLAKARDMEVMGKVSAFIVHDLKNLVYALSLIVENARNFISNPDFQKDMLSGIENTVTKMQTLISQLRVLPSRMDLNLEPAELSQLARDTFKDSPEKRLQFRGEPAMAMVDKTQMQKVVLNLVRNAMEASSETPVAVETGVDNAPFLRVTDLGCGMNPEFIRDSLFQPFVTTKPKGMGIGLYQCQQIVVAHGGLIEVSSQPGQGSTFTIKLTPANDKASREDA